MVFLILIETLLISPVFCGLIVMFIKIIKMSVGILTWISRAFIPFPDAAFRMLTGTVNCKF